MNIIRKIDFTLNSNQCSPGNYNKLVEIRRKLLHGITLNMREVQVLKLENIY